MKNIMEWDNGLMDKIGTDLINIPEQTIKSLIFLGNSNNKSWK